METNPANRTKNVSDKPESKRQKKKREQKA